MKLIIASNNKGKIREYKDIFEPFGFRVFSQGEADIRLEVDDYVNANGDVLPHEIFREEYFAISGL